MAFARSISMKEPVRSSVFTKWPPCVGSPTMYWPASRCIVMSVGIKKPLVSRPMRLESSADTERSKPALRQSLFIAAFKARTMLY